MAQRLYSKSSFKTSLLPLFYALGGAFLASLGALIEEGSISFGFTLGLVIIGPVIEEVLKPLGIIILLERDVSYFRSKAHIFWLCLAAALVFSLSENLLYVYVYLLPYFNHPHLYIETFIYRYTVCVLLHVSTTSVMAMGLMREFAAIKKNRGKFALENITIYIVLAAAIHGGYNLLSYSLSVKP